MLLAPMGKPMGWTGHQERRARANIISAMTTPPPAKNPTPGQYTPRGSRLRTAFS